MIEGLVSTIIPVYNRPQLLREAVASVLAQTYPGIEVIIVDDGSDDPGMTACLATCKDEGRGRVIVVRQGNRGPGAARQLGLKHASGEFVQFLDSDDLLYPIKCAASVRELRHFPEAGIVYGKTRNVGPLGKQNVPWKKTGEPAATLFPIVLGGRIWDTSTPLYRKSVVVEAGGWSDLINEEDWEFDCRVAALGVRLAWIDEWVSEQRAVANNRASSGGSTDPAKLRDRARARESILQSALRAKVPPQTAEFQQFVRYSFLVARQCAAVGLVTEAEHLVRCLNEAAPRTMMSIYLLAGRWIGFGRATRFGERARRILRRNSMTST